MEVYLDQGMGQTTSGLWVKRIGAAVAILLLLIGVAMVVKSLMSSKPTQKNRVTKINILVPDAPPPPPPPPKEQPKEQPKEIEQPKPQEVPQPPTESLKMEGAAGDSPSAFAAGVVKNDFIGGKPDMSVFAWYTSQISTRIEEALSTQKELAKAQYRLVVHVWVAADGRVERAELQGSSGDKTVDKFIRAALSELKSLPEAPPSTMPQPVKLRINSKVF